MVEKKIPFDQQTNKKINNKKKEPGRMWRVIKILFLVSFLLVLLAGGVGGYVIYSFIEETPALDPARLETVETSYLYDSSGEKVTELHDEQHRTAVELNDVPGHVKEAFIAIEDERFYDHFGFDITGSLRAAYTNFRAGSIVQGASTISQQLAQNAFLTTETTYERKVQEIWLAIQLERLYSKEEILEMYLNRVYFGNGAYGVEAASQTYFDKSVDELNLPEAAMLAGAVRSPNYYNPVNNKEAAESRKDTVLSNMRRVEFINETEYREALEQELNYAEARGPEYPYPYFVDYVIHSELLNILSNISSIGSREEAYRAIYTGGLQIHTTLEPSMQSHVEDVLSQEELYPATFKVDMTKAREAIRELPSEGTLTQAQLEELVDEEKGIAQPQSAIVLADPGSGRIQALGGGREYIKDADEVLRFSTLRQPGSAIKPITTYGPAFEEGTLGGAGSTLDDSPFKLTDPDWFPENFDREFRGMIPVREALVKSYNIPAIRAFEDLGPQTGAEYAQKMGVTTLHPDELNNLSLTLGGFYSGTSAIHMAQAYSVFANDGLKIELHTVEKVVDRHGDTLYEKNVSPEQVLGPQSTFMVNNILQDFVTDYLGSALQIDRPVAAKTGTTDNWKDVYLAAYTPNTVATFWMGYDEPKMGKIEQGWRYSTVFLREVFLKEFENLDIEEFERPDGIVELTVCQRSGKLVTEYCRDAGAARSDYFIDGQAPTESCDMHEDRRTYSRPSYIETDDRWSGGPGRIPHDAEENGLRVSISGRAEQSGSTTAEITAFDAYIYSDGVTLQWDYDGPDDIESFELNRYNAAGDSSRILDSNARQHSDENIELDDEYTYTLAARYVDGSTSEPAEVRVNTETDQDGEIVTRRDDAANGEIVIPDEIGSFAAIAESRLERLGLNIGDVQQAHHDEITMNRVIAIRPEPGTTVSEGTTVNLVVSRGPEN